MTSFSTYKDKILFIIIKNVVTIYYYIRVIFFNTYYF